MSSATPQPIRIFRPGTFTSIEGVVVSFGAAELQAIADGYDAARDPAPLVVGHPQIDHPAYGWVGSLSVDDGVLVAHPNRVEPAFAELVNAGRFAKVSAQFYPPEHDANPTPGAWALKHVGFLGAAAPAVKGLGTVSLADGDAVGLITIDQDTQEKTMPIQDTKSEEASFAERTTKLDVREAALATRERDAALAARASRHADHASFAEGLMSDGKLGKAGSDILITLLDELGDKQEPVSFGEGDANRMTPVAAMKKLLGGAKPLVSFGGLAKGGIKGGALTSFAAPAGYDVDPAQAAIFTRARELQDANANLSWMDAVRRASSN